MTGQQSVFGAGYLFGVPTGSTPTPVMFAALQDLAVDFSFDEKTLHGSQQYPLEMARGKGKIAIKASVGRIDPNLFNQVYFGLTATTGQKLNSIFEVGAVPASSTYTVTVTNSASFAVDLGVLNVTSGKFMTRVSSGPTAGQYSTAAGVYTFAAADASASVRISYTYTSSSTGSTLTGTNPQMGAGPLFALHIPNTFADGVAGSKTQWLNFPAVKSFKLSLPFKQDDFLLPSFDMAAMDDGTGNPWNYTATGPG